MARLPAVGGDKGNWGTILNEYLTETLDENGLLKEDVVTTSHIADASVTLPKLQGVAQPSGLATLDTDGKVPTAQIPTRLSESALDNRYEMAIIAQGNGIDTTGSLDSTTAFQALLDTSADGSVIYIPQGAVIRLTSQITVSHKISIKGTGELRFSDGIQASSAIVITGDNTAIHEISITNPNELAQITGGKNTAIDIHAHNVTISNVTVDRFQNGIVVAPDGEWEGVIISENRVSNVLGAGDGPGAGSNGEDRGDGITVWGSRTTVSKNIVFAKPGTDARIGIHAEGLPAYITTPLPTQDSLITIQGNVVSGQFRRGIVAEEISGLAIQGNVVKDATWWGISLANAPGGVIQGNSVIWSRTPADTQGQDWNVQRAGIAVIKECKGSNIQGNTIVALDGTSMPTGIALLPSGGSNPSYISVVGNTITLEGSATCPDGIRADTAQRAVISGNVIQITEGGQSHAGILSYYANGCVISSNIIRGVDSSDDTIGIGHYGDGSVTIHDNQIEDVFVGAAVINTTQYGASLQGNQLSNCTIGFDYFGTTAEVWDIYNRLRNGVPTPRVNVGSSVQVITVA